MERICSWCDRKMKPVHGDGAQTTHGICPDCVDNLSFQQGVDLQRFLNSLSTPILALDADGVILAASEQALELLDRDQDAVCGHLAGDVVECEKARLPGGCGRTIHCQGCTIRRAVVETQQTGQPVLSRPATVTVSRDDSPDWHLTISTVKRDGMVLLRIAPRE